MSIEYDNYLIQHKRNVYKGYEWIRHNLVELLKGNHDDYEWQLMHNHDYSKSDKEEYDAYDAYFYGGNRSYQVMRDFRKAWLRHIHHNPHHWQHWVLINDDPNEGEILLDMDYIYIIEMICDWWAFSWAKDNLYEIFNWYDAHKNYMKLSEYTKRTVEHILTEIRNKLDELKENTNE
jgi:hypothetical protein